MSRFVFLILDWASIYINWRSPIRRSQSTKHCKFYPSCALKWRKGSDGHYGFDIVFFESLLYFSTDSQWPVNRLVCAVPHTLTSYVSFPHISTVCIDPPVSKEQKNGICMPSSVKQIDFNFSYCSNTPNDFKLLIYTLLLNLNFTRNKQKHFPSLWKT